ncbi:MAG: hypothetical protein KC519_21415 [Anaerolineae bacterium]|nr:hypothetical protein [Anaerolineae bacterium]
MERDSSVPSPAFTFGFILATLLGAVFHLIFGGDIRRLALYLISAWVGFALGHFAGVAFGINSFNVGTLRAVPAFTGALVALVVAYSLSASGRRKRTQRR